jgi:hypothetical protein
MRFQTIQALLLLVPVYSALAAPVLVDFDDAALMVRDLPEELVSERQNTSPMA